MALLAEDYVSNMLLTLAINLIHLSKRYCSLLVHDPYIATVHS